MNTYNFDVNFATGRIYGPDLLLVVNDHNSTTFKFTFNQEGRYVFKLLYPDNTIYVQDIINRELVLTKGVLNQEGNYKFEISLYGDDNRLTTARIKEFPVRLELVKTDEPVQADDRLPILDNLIEETNKVLESAKNGEFDGATFTPSVSEDGDLSWTNDKGKENPPTVNIKGTKGDPGAVKMQVVDTLPDVGDTDTIYLVKKNNPGEQNLYDEYIYTETSGWEHIGDTSVDLTDYYTKEETDEKFNNKQDTLTAGDNITIEDNVISASGGNIPTYVYLGYTVPTGIISDEKFLSEISQSITNCLTSGASAKARIDLQSATLSTGDIVSVAYTCSRTIATTRTSFTYYSDNQWIQNYIDTDDLHHYIMRSLTVSGTWSNNVFNATRILSDFYKSNETLSMVSSSYIKANVLTKTNTTAYTPTSNYHPATKKYVDDSLSSLDSTNTLEEQHVFFKRFDKETYPGVDNLFTGGTDDTGICTYFSHVLTKMGEGVSSLWDAQGILFLVLPTVSMTLTFAGTRFVGAIVNTGNMLTQYDLNLSYEESNGQYIVSLVTMGQSTPNVDIPYYESSITPKDYVDTTHYQNMSGYDATKTQVLKNVNGTLTWQNE